MRNVFSAIAIILLGTGPAWGAYSTNVTTETYASIESKQSTSLLFTLEDRPRLTVFTDAGKQSASVLADPALGGRLLGTVDVEGAAQAGLLRLHSEAHGLARHTGLTGSNGSYYDLFASVSGRAAASSSDTIVWSFASLAVGTPLSMRFTVSVDANLSYRTLIASTGNDTRSFGNAFVNWSGQFVGSGVQGTFQSPSAPAAYAGRTFGGVDSSDLRGLGSFTFEQRVLSGVPVDLTFSASASVSVTVRDMCFLNPSCIGSAGGIEAKATSDMMHTFAWGGVQEVRLSDGSILDLGGLSAVSSSGFDYRLAAQPVPEPTTWAMLALGLAGLAVARRNCHRRSAQQPGTHGSRVTA